MRTSTFWNRSVAKCKSCSQMVLKIRISRVPPTSHPQFSQLLWVLYSLNGVRSQVSITISQLLPMEKISNKQELLRLIDPEPACGNLQSHFSEPSRYFTIISLFSGKLIDNNQISKWVLFKAWPVWIGGFKVFLEMV